MKSHFNDDKKSSLNNQKLFKPKNHSHYSTIDSLLGDGFIRVETNFNMKQSPTTPKNTPRNK